LHLKKTGKAMIDKSFHKVIAPSLLPGLPFFLGGVALLLLCQEAQ
jgi:hypothetical protein